jgi:hypothetical protein
MLNCQSINIRKIAGFCKIPLTCSRKQFPPNLAQDCGDSDGALNRRTEKHTLALALPPHLVS